MSPWAGMQIDLVTRERTLSGTTITTIIECKSYSRPVGMQIVVSFANAFGLSKIRNSIDRAIIVSAEGFTAQARSTAQTSGIDLLELDDLKQRLKNIRPQELEQAKKSIDAEDARRDSTHPSRVFVVMPFASEFQDVYILGIREVAEKLGFVVERADDIEHNASILEIIQDNIRDSRAIIGDITGRNPNVFYEIGYAHALNKPIILIGKKGGPIPFDVQSVNLILYESIVDLRDRLEKPIRRTILPKS